MYVTVTNEAKENLAEVKNRLPSSLCRFIIEIKSFNNVSKVVAFTLIPEGVKFGPIFTDNIETKKLNWPHHINIASKKDKTCNLVGFGQNDNLYYKTERQINKGEILRVHIEDDFIKALGVNPDKFYPLSCTPCSLGFLTKLYFIKHKIKCQYSPQRNGVTQCPFCEILLIEPKYLEDHMKRCSGKYKKNLDAPNLTPSDISEGTFVTQRIFKCLHCSYITQNSATLTEHIEVHTESKNYECNICKKHFKSAYDLRKHSNTHIIGESFECSECTYKGNRKSALNKHIKSKHRQDKKYVCSMCPLQFGSKCKVMTHMKVHEGNRDYVCKVCKKAFTREDNLRVHMNIHLGIKFKCSVCTYESHYKAILKEHMKKNHKLENSVIAEHINELLQKMEVDKT